MNYKRLISNQKTRFAILSALQWIPDRVMLAIQYRIKLGRKCHFSNPRRWTEKLQLYKMYYRNTNLFRCVDKYEVRSFVEERGCSENLVKLYGIWHNASEINFGNLPNQFVLKTTNGGGGLDVVIVSDKSQLDVKATVDLLNNKLRKRVNAGREWAYEGIKTPRVICEELLINKENPKAGVEDFKILCFSGEPKFIIVDKDRYVDHKRNIYTQDWQLINVITDHKQFESDYPKPKNLDKMLDVARKLSADFPFVRVDLYNIDGSIYFGELTFYPWTGYVQFTPDSFDYELGSMMDCSFAKNYE